MFDVYDGGKGTQEGLLEAFYYVEIKEPTLGGRALYDDINQFMRHIKHLIECGSAVEAGVTNMTRETYEALPEL